MAVSTGRLAPTVRALLFVDAAVEALLALGLSGLIGPIHTWLDVGRPATIAAAAAFAIAAATIGAMAFNRQTPAPLVRSLALVNAAGGAAVWLAAILFWDRFQPEGRWVVAFAGDIFLALGVLEFLALRRGPSAIDR